MSTLYLTDNISVIHQVINLYGSLDYIYDFINLNPIYSIIDVINAGSTINFDDTFVIIPSTTTIVDNTPPSNPILSVKGINNQSLFDLIIRYYGSLDYINEFLNDNSIYQITDYANNNTYSIEPIKNNKNVSIFDVKSSIFATYINKSGKSFNFSFSFAFN